MIKKLEIDRRDLTNQQIEDKINEIIDWINNNQTPRIIMRTTPILKSKIPPTITIPKEQLTPEKALRFIRKL